MEILTFVKVNVQKWQSYDSFEKIMKREKNVRGLLVDFHSMTLKNIKKTLFLEEYSVFIYN